MPRGSIDMSALNSFLSSVGSEAGPDLILSPGKELYHYTSLPGLLGIIENGDLWLTHTLYLNDEEEMAHGDHVAAEAIVAARGKSAADAKKSAYLDQLAALLGRPSKEGVYICCFCQRDNLLSQWRGYGANGAGVSLQFDSAGFAQWTGADCAHGLMRFWKVFYKSETSTGSSMPQSTIAGTQISTLSFAPSAPPTPSSSLSRLSRTPTSWKNQNGV